MSHEPGNKELEDVLLAAETRLISAATLVELGIVLESRYGPDAAIELDNFLIEAGISVVSLTADHARHARNGWRRFGKGRGHPAQLNLGDCYAYGLAVAMGCPILCTGNDFAATDIEVNVSGR